MKHVSTFVLIAALALITISPTPAFQASQAAPEALIENARALLKAPELPREAVTRALADALSAALLILPKTDYANEFKSRIGTVRKMFEDGALFEDKARQYLGLAYKLVSGGKTWEVPAELKAADGTNKGIEKAVELCGKLLDSALADRKAGRNVEACRALLDFVILIITPIEA